MTSAIYNLGKCENILLLDIKINIKESSSSFYMKHDILLMFLANKK